MTEKDDAASEIRDGLDREVGRRFDARRLIAGLEEGGTRTTHGTTLPAGPLGRLPVAVQWIGLVATIVIAGFGIRSLYLERVRSGPQSLAEARPAADLSRAPIDVPQRSVEEKTPQEQPPERLLPRPPVRDETARTESSPVVAAPTPAPDVQREPAPPPAEPARGTVGEAPAVSRLVEPVPPMPSKKPTPPPRPPAAVSSVARPVPGSFAVVGKPTGGVSVLRLTLGGMQLWPVIREAPEVGATLVIVPTSLRSSSRGADSRFGGLAVMPAALTGRSRGFGETELSGDRLPDLGGAVGFGDLSGERSIETETGAYYARLFLGTGFDPSPRSSQGLMGNGLQVVPLREGEVWGDEAQESFLKTAFRLGSVIAVNGARIPRAAGAGPTEASFVAGVGGQVFDVTLRCTSAQVEGAHRIDLRLSRRRGPGTNPIADVGNLEASLLLENGRIAILGVPLRPRWDLDAFARPGPTIAFLALSPRFSEFAPSGDAEAVLVVKDDVEPPLLIERTSPEYPRQAREARIEGKVILQVVIRKDGSVDGVQVLKVPEVAGAEYLVEAAASAVRQWRYLPARVHGDPVNAYFHVSVEFSLRKDGDPNEGD